MSVPTLLIDIAQLEKMVSLGRTTIERLIKAGNFPRPLYIVGRSQRWYVPEIEEWVKKKLESKSGGM